MSRQLAMSVQVDFGISNQPPYRTATIRIQDETSGIHFLKVQLDADQFLALMSGGTAQAVAGFTSHPERIGMVSERGQVAVDAWTEYPTLEAANAYAEAWRVENAWDVVSVRKNNTGEWVINGTRWVTTERQES